VYSLQLYGDSLLISRMSRLARLVIPGYPHQVTYRVVTATL